MKRILILLLAVCRMSLPGISQSVGIGTTTPNASAVLDIQSTNKGALIPRMTTAQRKAILNPESGLMVFDTDKRAIFIFEYPIWGQLSFRPTDVMEPIARSASDGSAGDYLGHAVAMSGDYAVAGAPEDDIGSNDAQGSAYVFHRVNGNWIQEAKIVASDGGAGDQFGFSISMLGDSLLIGAPYDNISGTSRGSAYIFIRSGTNWVQQAKLFAADGAEFDEFGHSVSLNAYHALIGCPGDDIGSNMNQGSAYLYTKNGTSWLLAKKLTATDGAANDEFGRSVSVDVNFAIVGSPKDDRTNTDNGSAHIFWGSAIPAWGHVQTLSAGENSISFGLSVFIKGDKAIVSYGVLPVSSYTNFYTRGALGIWAVDSPPGPFGAYCSYTNGDYFTTNWLVADVGNNSSQGYVVLYKKTGADWFFARYIHDATGQVNGFFGSAVAMDGLNIIIGAKGKSGNRGQVHFLNIE